MSGTVSDQLPTTAAGVATAIRSEESSSSNALMASVASGARGSGRRRRSGSDDGSTLRSDETSTSSAISMMGRGRGTRGQSTRARLKDAKADIAM